VHVCTLQPVRVWRVMVGDTVEGKLLSMQERKKNLASAALQDDGDRAGDGGGEDGNAVTGLGSGAGNQQKLTVEELTDFFR